VKSVHISSLSPRPPTALQSRHHHLNPRTKDNDITATAFFSCRDRCPDPRRLSVDSKVSRSSRDSVVSFPNNGRSPSPPAAATADKVGSLRTMAAASASARGGGGRRRPTTAASVIERLHIEKVYDEGITFCSGGSGGCGLVAPGGAGIFVGTHCYVILLVMSGFFSVVGAILTAISYRPRELGEDIEKFISRQEWSTSNKVIGPLLLMIGLVMGLAGLSLCFISRKISKSDEERPSLEDQEAGFQYYFNHGDMHGKAAPLMATSATFMPTISSALFAHEPALPLLLPSNTWDSAVQTKRSRSLQHVADEGHHAPTPVHHKVSSTDSSRSCQEAGATAAAVKRCSLPVIDSLLVSAAAAAAASSGDNGERKGRESAGTAGSQSRHNHSSHQSNGKSNADVLRNQNRVHPYQTESLESSCISADHNPQSAMHHDSTVINDQIVLLNDQHEIVVGTAAPSGGGRRGHATSSSIHGILQHNRISTRPAGRSSASGVTASVRTTIAPKGLSRVSKTAVPSLHGSSSNSRKSAALLHTMYSVDSIACFPPAPVSSSSSRHNSIAELPPPRQLLATHH